MTLIAFVPRNATSTLICRSIRSVIAPPTAISEDYLQLLEDLFGVMAYGELSGFERLFSDARFSPTLADRRALGGLAVVEFQHFELVAAHLQTLGSNVETAMEPFVDSINAFHERTRPGDWFESLMKAYAMDAVSGDFYREISALLDPATQALVVRIHTAENQSAFLRARLQSALAEDQRGWPPVWRYGAGGWWEKH